MSERRPSSGEILFARYAYPPNELGYCGTGDGAALLDVASGIGTQNVEDRARGFDGAWPYLQIIATAAAIADPLDARVVDAYWVGNQLLDAVDPKQFAAEARRRFADQSGADWQCLKTATAPPVPHHSFHVFAIYPWTGLLRRSGAPTALEVLDRCRIRWGEVTQVEGDHLEVRTRKLCWDHRALTLGPPSIERARWTKQGRSLQHIVSPGDWVSLHWDWACDTLSENQVTALAHFTDRQLDATNSSGHPARSAPDSGPH